MKLLFFSFILTLIHIKLVVWFGFFEILFPFIFRSSLSGSTEFRGNLLVTSQIMPHLLFFRLQIKLIMLIYRNFN